MSTTSTDVRYDQAAIEADETVPMIHIWRDFAGTPEQLFRAHTDRDLYERWVGPAGSTMAIDHWDPSDGGSFRFHGESHGVDHAFRGCFHTVRPDRIVQTFTWEGMPDGVALETLTFERPRRRPHPPARDFAVRQLRGPRRLAAQRHGGRRERRVRRHRPDAGRWHPLSCSPPSPPGGTG